MNKEGFVKRKSVYTYRHSNMCIRDSQYSRSKTNFLRIINANTLPTRLLSISIDRERAFARRERFVDFVIDHMDAESRRLRKFKRVTTSDAR